MGTAAEVQAALEKILANVDFTRQGRGKAMGEELLDVAADQVIDRTLVMQREYSPPPGVAGKPLAPLKPSTLKRKAKAGFPLVIGVETGEMISRVQVAGRREITPDSARMTYGTSGGAQDKALWFTVGCAVDKRGRKQGRLPRPWYGIDEEGWGKIMAAAKGMMVEMLQRLWG